MKLVSVVLTLLFAIVFAGAAFAVSPGKTVEYAGGGAGKVIFDGRTHSDKGLKCNDCHTKVFAMKKGTAKITMAEMNARNNCGSCHNGTKAFSSKEAANCSKCHKH